MISFSSTHYKSFKYSLIFALKVLLASVTKDWASRYKRKEVNNHVLHRKRSIQTCVLYIDSLCTCVRARAWCVDVRLTITWVSISLRRKKVPLILPLIRQYQLTFFPSSCRVNSKRGLKESWIRGTICFLSFVSDENFQFCEYYFRLPD